MFDGIIQLVVRQLLENLLRHRFPGNQRFNFTFSKSISCLLYKMPDNVVAARIGPVIPGFYPRIIRQLITVTDYIPGTVYINISFTSSSVNPKYSSNRTVVMERFLGLFSPVKILSFAKWLLFSDNAYSTNPTVFSGCSWGQNQTWETAPDSSHPLLSTDYTVFSLFR